MSQSVNSRPSAFAKLPKHGFDLSHSFMFSAPCGFLLPCLHDVLHPSEKVYLSCQIDTLTQPLHKPAKTTCTERVDYFFVPMKKLFSPFNQLIENVDDFESSFFRKEQFNQGDSVEVFPRINLQEVVRYNLNEDLIDYSDSSGLIRCLNSVRLLDHLGYNPDIFASYASQANAADYQPSVSPALLCAYQAIYYDYYRLSNFTVNHIEAYNLDTVVNNPIDLVSFYQVSMFLHTRPYNKDYFKNIQPSPLQGSLGVVFDPQNLSQENINQWLGANILTDGFTNEEVFSVTTDDNTFYTSGARTAFAFEKLLRISQRAGKHYDDQVAAHFGFKVPKGIGNECYYLGSHEQKIVFGTVVSTATSSAGGVNTPLGELAGRGYSAHGNHERIEFTAPCHGILMAIYSVEPDLMYHPGIDKLNTLNNIFDFYTPEFDKLGMQPLFGYERVALEGTASNRLGWQWRYLQFKQKYNRVTYGFTNRELFSIDRSEDYGDNGVLSYGAGPHADYAITWNGARNSLITAANYRQTLYVSPNDTDQIFLVGFNPLAYLRLDNEQDYPDDDTAFSDFMRGGISKMYATDPFIVKVNFDYKKVSPMSTFGEPDL